MREKEEDNPLSLVLQIAMYKFRGKRDLGEVVHVIRREPTGTASAKTGNAIVSSASEVFTPQSLVVLCAPVTLLETSWRILSSCGGMIEPRQTPTGDRRTSR